MLASSVHNNMGVGGVLRHLPAGEREGRTFFRGPAAEVMNPGSGKT